MSVPIHSMADGEGFEPSAQIHGQRLSRAPHSTAQPTVQVERHTGCAPVPMPWKGIMLLLHQWRNLLWFTLFSTPSSAPSSLWDLFVGSWLPTSRWCIQLLDQVPSGRWMDKSNRDFNFTFISPKRPLTLSWLGTGARWYQTVWLRFRWERERKGSFSLNLIYIL